MADQNPYLTAADSEPERDLLYSIIGKGKFTSGEKESTSLQYLKALASSSVDNLNHEPERLKEEKEQLLEQTQNLAFQNYQTFIQAAECSKKIYKDFNIIEDNLHALLDNVPAFASQVETFQSHSQEISVVRKQNSLVLSRHTQLLEILEIPQLMDTCVRNGYYEEALELSNYVKRLGKKLSSIHIISDISKEVKNATQVMLKQLLQQLRTNIQLPACLRIIGYLRQLEVFTEAELRIKFLQARDSWFQGILDGIPTSDRYHHISKVVEASRVHLFDIITQYRAIFSDDDPITVHKEDELVNYTHLLQSWVTRKVSAFIQMLEYDLRCGISGRLDSVLGQCMYFGLSFSRVGADFRSLLIPVFHRAVMKSTKEKLELTTKRFEETMSSYTPILTSRSLHQKLSGLSLRSKFSDDESLSPPQELLDVSPLAHYTNGVLTVFNELRQYPVLSIAAEVRKHLKESLERVVRALAAWARVELQSRGLGENEQIHRICDLAAKDLFPYLSKCFDVVFPSANLSRVFGLSSTATSVSGRRNLRLDVVDLVSSLAEFLTKDELENVSHVEVLEESVEDEPPVNSDGQIDESAFSDTGDKTNSSEMNDPVKSPLRILPDELEDNKLKVQNNILNLTTNDYDESSVVG